MQLRANRSRFVVVILGAACLSFLSQTRAIGADFGASASSIQSQQESSFASDPIALSAKDKETLYVAHAIKEVEKGDPYWILSVERK